VQEAEQVPGEAYTTQLAPTQLLAGGELQSEGEAHWAPQDFEQEPQTVPEPEYTLGLQETQEPGDGVQ
jgi:hypothetical protein